MSDAGKALLKDAGMAGKGGPSVADEDHDDQEGEPGAGMVASAEELCGHCGIDKSKAPAIAATMARMIEIHTKK